MFMHSGRCVKENTLGTPMFSVHSLVHHPEYKSSHFLLVALIQRK